MAAIGTLVGNPWTFPIMWWGSLELGKWVLGYDSSVQFGQTFGMESIFYDIYSIMIPWMLGSLLISIILGPPIFFLMYWLFRILRERFYKKLDDKRDISKI